MTTYSFYPSLKNWILTFSIGVVFLLSLAIIVAPEQGISGFTPILVFASIAFSAILWIRKVGTILVSNLGITFHASESDIKLVSWEEFEYVEDFTQETGYKHIRLIHAGKDAITINLRMPEIVQFFEAVVELAPDSNPVRQYADKWLLRFASLENNNAAKSI